jgi:hypothetical protein
MVTFRCVGSSSSIEGKFTGMNHCEIVDKDGDKFLVRNVAEGPKQSQETLTGTGKYEGMVRTGGTAWITLRSR